MENKEAIVTTCSDGVVISYKIGDELVKRCYYKYNLELSHISDSFGPSLVSSIIFICLEYLSFKEYNIVFKNMEEKKMEDIYYEN